MPFPYDKYPWLNFQELNLAYFIRHFREIFQQWDQLYHDLLDWKDATDADLAEWKTNVESGISSWETGLTAALEVWKTQTQSDISSWETATMTALDAWKTVTTTVFEQIRTEAAASATAAAGSASSAQTALAGAQAAQAAAEAAAEGIQSELSQILTNTVDIADLKAQLNNVENAIGNEETELLSNYERASYWSVETSVAELKSAATYIAYHAVELEQDTKYIGYIFQGTSVKQDPLVIVDENYNILNRYRGTNSQYNTFELTIDNPLAKYALVTGYSASNPCSLKKIKLNNIPEIINSITTELTTHENDIEKLYKKDITESKYLSIIGDSISALQGTIPEGYLAYYTTNRNFGVETANDIWWGIVASTLGMTILINNSWSGSRVCDSNYTEGDAIPASYPERCQALDDGTHNPDYVIIAMGVNDYSYNSIMGEWDGKTMPVDDVDFTQSYALMINRINSKYPNAKIFCLAPWFVQRGQDKGINYTNSQAAHLTESKYGDVIRKLCDMLGAIYVDSYVGFNRYNYYPTYCEDSAETPTHPNKAGQAIMGKVISEKIRSLIF